MELTEEQYKVLKRYLNELWRGQSIQSKRLLKSNYGIDSLSDVLTDCGLYCFVEQVV